MSAEAFFLEVEKHLLAADIPVVKLPLVRQWRIGKRAQITITFPSGNVKYAGRVQDVRGSAESVARTLKGFCE